MSSFYEDEDKITFDKAEEIVDRFIRRYEARVTHITSKEVANKYDVETSRHNLVRINDALDGRLEVSRESGTRATQYKLQE